MTLREKLAMDLYKKIREAKENAACLSDFQLEKRYLEDEFEYKFASLGDDADKEVDE